MSFDKNNCALGSKCSCARDPKYFNCPNWGRSSLPCPPVVQSKQDRLRVTKQAWDKKRDKMMREAERRLDKLKPQSETEEKLREIRHNPMKHLQRKGVKSFRKPV